MQSNAGSTCLALSCRALNDELEIAVNENEKRCQRKEITAVDYFIHESITEWEAVEGWENEGGRLRQNHDSSPDSFRADYLRRRTEPGHPHWPTRKPQ